MFITNGIHYDTVHCLRLEEEDFSPDGLVSAILNDELTAASAPQLSRFGHVCAAMRIVLPQNVLQLLFDFLAEPYGAEIRAVEAYPHNEPRAYATLARLATRRNPHWTVNVRRIEYHYHGSCARAGMTHRQETTVRQSEHLRDLRKKRHDNPKLQMWHDAKIAEDKDFDFFPFFKVRDILERKSEENPTLFMIRVLAAEQALIDGDEQRFNVCLIAGGHSSDANFRGGCSRNRNKGRAGPGAKWLRCLHCAHVFQSTVYGVHGSYRHRCSILSTCAPDTSTASYTLFLVRMRLDSRSRGCHRDPIEHLGEGCLEEVSPLRDDENCPCGLCMSRLETGAQYATRVRSDRGMGDCADRSDEVNDASD